MKKTKSIGRIFGLALVLVLIGTMFGGLPTSISKVEASPATIYVPDNYSTIQAAVNASSPGDIIIVRNGTYTENIDVNKDHLTIQSESGAEATIVQAANPDDHVFGMTADYINIEGFTVKGATGTAAWKAGIYLTSDACSCVISDNSLLGNDEGICLWHSSGNTLKNNTCSDMRMGIELLWSPNNILDGNTLLRNWWGTHLQSSSNNTLRANTFIEDGLYIADTNKLTVENNLVNGKPLIYKEDVSGETIEGIEVGQLILVNCSEMIVRNVAISRTRAAILLRGGGCCLIANNTLSENYEGIELQGSSENILRDNACIKNRSTGIFLWARSDNNVLEGNECSENTVDGIYLHGEVSGNLLRSNNCSRNGDCGVYLGYSSNNTLRANICSENRNYGLYFWYASNNTIYFNSFVDNGNNAHLGEDSTNLWHSPEEITYAYNGNAHTSYLGNYWSDYAGSDADGDGIGETPYPIDSDADNYPLREPFENYEIGEDTTPPTVSGVSPQNGGTDVGVDTVVTATFSEAMDETTIDETSFTLAGSVVAGTVTYNPATYTATFTPDADLDYNHEYTATLSTAITDLAGNPLAEPYSWSFTTSSTGAEIRANIASHLFAIPLDQIDEPMVGANYDYNNFGENPSSICGYQGGHSGIDFQTKDVAGPLTADRTFYAVSRGTVIRAGDDDYHTISVWDKGKGISVLYLHARSINPNVSIGAQINVGDALGIQGEEGPGVTGEHVHLEVRNGTQTSGSCGALYSLNPELYIPQYLSVAPTTYVTTATGTGTAYFTNNRGTIDDLEALPTIPPGAPAGVTFPHGLFSFKVTGLSSEQEVTITIELPDPVPEGTLWWKYENGLWDSVGIGSDNGDNVITVTLKDEGTGDFDDIPGQITDPGGPGSSGAVGWEIYPIDKMRVLLPWLVLLAALIAGASLLVLRRRRSTHHHGPI